MIIRDEYLQQLRLLKDKNLIKVITGIRRCGKSTLLELFRQELIKSKISKTQIQFFNFEEEENYDLRDWRAIHKKIESNLVVRKMNYIFLDEVQKIEHFEELVDSLFVKKNIDLYITGSNAFLLSGELATLLTGRYITIHLLPFSFKEYIKLFPNASHSDLFNKYINSSSLPEAINLSSISTQLSFNYLSDVYETIVKKDIYTRHEIRNKANFERVLKFVLDSVGSFISSRNIAKNLDFSTKKRETYINHQTVSSYLDYLSEVYLLYKINRYDIRGKKILKTQDKYYVVDLGFRNLLLGDKSNTDLGHKLENIVFLELKRRPNLNVFVGKYAETEVDFVVENAGGRKVYYKVAWSTVEQQVLDRELSPLQKISDNHPKFLITTDPENVTYEGIQKINIVDWLLKNYS
jgi:predicted AAA+ superfamily ATPase